MDWVGHHVDIAHWGLGLDHTGPVEVEGTGFAPADGLWNAHTEYDIMCRYADGLEIILSSKFAGGTKWYGQDGWVYVDRGAIDSGPKNVLNEKIGPDEILLYKSNDHIGNFIECIKTRRETITPCEVAHRSATPGHLALIAMELGRKIKFNPDTEEIIDDEAASGLLGKSMRSPWHL